MVVILLLLFATMSVQGASLTAHEHSRASDRCCGVCHAGHLALVYPANLLGCLFAEFVEWLDPAGGAEEFPAPLVSTRLSRAPPA